MKRSNHNIIEVTRKNLLQYNSRMLIIFLLIVNSSIGILVVINVYHEQKAELLDIAGQEINELKSDPDGYLTNQTKTPQTNRIKGTFIAFFISPNHRLINIDGFSPALHEAIIKKIGHWKPEKMSEKYIELSKPGKQPVYLFLAAQNLHLNNRFVGTLYVGKDVNLLRNLIVHYLFLLIGLSIVFFLIALLVGHIMTKRAMTPIVRSYDLQSEFIANASHELRTPLSVLKSGLDVLEFEERDMFSSFSKHIIMDLKEELNNTTQLVNNLLYLARSDSGYPITLTSLELSDLMEQVIRTFQHLARSNKINLQLEKKHLLTVVTDKEKVKQIVYILVENAIKYTPSEGTVSLTYGISDTNHLKNAFYIIVKDDGIGIPEVEQERIFDRFYRVDKSRSRENGSSGLGLAIARSLADVLNGKIEVVSTIGKGSTFSLILPMQNIKNA